MNNNHTIDEVTIRRATKADVAAIALLLTELNAEEGSSATIADAPLLQALFAPAHGVHLAALVACVGDEVVGTLLYYPGYDTLSASYGYHLADMVVTSAHQRAGIGRALVKALAEHTLAEEKQWVSLTALKSNARAYTFYQSLGMHEVDVRFFAIGQRALAQL